MANNRMPLEDRIKQIRAEADAVIDAHVELMRDHAPNVPVQVLRNMLTNRAFGCQCTAVLNLAEGK